jgi:hypothetical protein
MLAWDIETTGFNPAKELVTVAACYTTEKQTVYTFAELDTRGNVVRIHDFDQKREAFLKELDDAPILAAYNGATFDIPFITTAFNVHPGRVMQWVMKSVDIFETAKRATGRTFPLDMALGLNGFKTAKTGSGADAVVQAKEGKWEELASYCAMDAKLTYEVSVLPRIALPEPFYWRKRNGGRTHDPSDVLFMLLGPDYRVTFEKGVLDPSDDGEDITPRCESISLEVLP